MFDSPEAAFANYVGRGAFKTWPPGPLADYLVDGLSERPDGTVELACAPRWEAGNYAAQDNHPRRALRRIESPVTIYRAQSGSTCSIGDLASPHRVVTVEGASHFLPMERPEMARRALIAAIGT